MSWILHICLYFILYLPLCIHKGPEYGPNLDPDLQHWLKLISRLFPEQCGLSSRLELCCPEADSRWAPLSPYTISHRPPDILYADLSNTLELCCPESDSRWAPLSPYTISDKPWYMRTWATRGRYVIRTAGLEDLPFFPLQKIQKVIKIVAEH